MFEIIKRTSGFWHLFNNSSKEVNVSDFEVVLDAVAQTYILQCKNGANIPNIEVPIANIIVRDETGANVDETFATVALLKVRLIALGYTPYLNASGLTPDQVDAINGANAPTASNVFATMADIPSTSSFVTLATAQTISGIKTFLNGMLGLRNVANTFTSFFTNANTASRTYTLQDKNYTLADDADLTLKLPIEVAMTTGTSISFEVDKIYGEVSNPVAGGITLDATNAKLGVTNIIVHNDASEPSYDPEFKRLKGSQDYLPSFNNYIYCTYMDASNINYTITQQL